MKFDGWSNFAAQNRNFTVNFERNTVVVFITESIPMNRLGIRLLFALLSVACFAGEVRAQNGDLPLGVQINPPTRPGVGESVPALPQLSIVKFSEQQNHVEPPPRRTPAAAPTPAVPTQGTPAARPDSTIRVAQPAHQVDPTVQAARAAQAADAARAAEAARAARIAQVVYDQPINQSQYPGVLTEAYRSTQANRSQPAGNYPAALSQPVETQGPLNAAEHYIPDFQYVHPNGVTEASQAQLQYQQQLKEYQQQLQQYHQQQKQYQLQLQQQQQQQQQQQPAYSRTLSGQDAGRLHQRTARADWGYPQDIDDPFGERPSTEPTDPPTIPRPSSIPSTPSLIQDPEDPFQQLPGSIEEPTPRPRPGTGIQDPPFEQPEPQDTEPRPLPNGQLTPPTQLPIPPRDRTPTTQDPDLGSQDNGNNGNGGQGAESEEPFVYPKAVPPGRQSYPGATSLYEPDTPPGEATPTDTSQVIYGDSRLKDQNQGFIPGLGVGSGLSPGSISGSIPGLVPGSIQDPHNPAAVSSTSLDRYAPPAVTPQVATVGYQTECVECPEQFSFRPELAIGLSPDDPCFEPAFYLSLFGGLNSVDDLTGQSPVDGATSSSFDFDNGVGFGFALGQYQGYNLRTEVEYTFRTNDTDQISLTENVGDAFTSSDFGFNGQLSAHAGMANLIWQFRGHRSRWIRPYVGAGAGFAFLNANFNRLGQDVLTNGNDGDSTFAYQFFAGLNTQLTRRMDVFLEYRYFAADSLDLETNFANVNGGTGSVFDDYDYRTDNVFFGVRLKF